MSDGNSDSFADDPDITRSTTDLWTSIRGPPPLTTIFTYKSSCIGRWLAPFPAASVNLLFSTNPSDAPGPGDPWWTECQPYNYQPTYSPGVCSDHMRLANIVQSQLVSGDRVITRQEGNYCPRELQYAQGTCEGTWTKPLEAFAVITGTIPNTVVSSGSTYTETTLFLGYLTPIYSNGQRVMSSWDPRANTTTVYSAVLFADPLKMLWEGSDLANFPTAYATSLAKRVGVSFTPSATPGSSSFLPSQTASSVPHLSPSNSSQGLSTGAKAGIGVGSAVGFAFTSAVVAYLIVRRRRHRQVLASNHASQHQPPELVE